MFISVQRRLRNDELSCEQCHMPSSAVDPFKKDCKILKTVKSEILYVISSLMSKSTNMATNVHCFMISFKVDTVRRVKPPLIGLIDFETNIA